MKIVKDAYNKAHYSIKIGDVWRTIAVLQTNPFRFVKGAPKFNLYFLDYGEEYIDNYGNYEINIYGKDCMTLDEAIEKTTPIVQKKLYKIASEILSGLQIEQTGKEVRKFNEG